MTSSKSVPQRLGASWVSSVVQYLRDRGLTHVRPIGLAGGGFTARDDTDTGDLEHYPDTTVELKNAADSADLSRGLKQVLIAQKNTGTPWHWLFKKYRGHGPAMGYAICTIDQAVTKDRLLMALRQMAGEDNYQDALAFARAIPEVPSESQVVA